MRSQPSVLWRSSQATHHHAKSRPLVQSQAVIALWASSLSHPNLLALTWNPVCDVSIHEVLEESHACQPSVIIGVKLPKTNPNQASPSMSTQISEVTKIMEWVDQASSWITLSFSAGLIGRPQQCLFNMPYQVRWPPYSDKSHFFESRGVVFHAASRCPSCSVPIYLKSSVTWIKRSCVAWPEPVQFDDVPAQVSRASIDEVVCWADPKRPAWLNKVMNVLAVPSPGVSFDESNELLDTSDGPGKPRRLVSCWCTIQYKVHNPNDSNHPHLILKTIPTGPCTCLSQSTLYQPLSLSDHYLPWLVDCHVYLDPHLNACSSNQIVVSCNLHYISPCPERASLIHYQYHLLSYLSCPRSILIVPSLFASVLVNTCSSNQIVVSCNHVLFVVLV